MFRVMKSLGILVIFSACYSHVVYPQDNEAKGPVTEISTRIDIDSPATQIRRDAERVDQRVNALFGTSDGLVVPVYPSYNPGNQDVDPLSEDFWSAYIITKDGAVFTFKDWALGALEGSDPNAKPTEFLGRIRTGELGTAVAGEDAPEVIGAPVPVSLLRPGFFESFTPTKQTAVQAVRQFVCTILCKGPPSDDIPLVLAGARAYSPMRYVGGADYDAGQFQEQFANEMVHVLADWRERQVLIKMAEDAGVDVGHILGYDMRKE